MRRQFSLVLLNSQLPRNRTPSVTNLPELGVISTHQEDDCHAPNDSQHQQDTACSSSHQHLDRPPCDVNDEGLDVYEHHENGFSGHEQESDEEVMRFMFIYIYVQ